MCVYDLEYKRGNMVQIQSILKRLKKQMDDLPLPETRNALRRVFDRARTGKTTIIMCNNNLHYVSKRMTLERQFEHHKRAFYAAKNEWHALAIK